MNNEIKDNQGKVIGYRCFGCGEIKQSMWGTTCNKCRSKHEEANKLTNEIAELKKVIASLKFN